MQLLFNYAVSPQKNSGFFSTTGCLFPTRKKAKIFLTQLLPAWELLLNSLFTPISEQWSQIIPPLPLITQTVPLDYPDHSLDYSDRSPWLLRLFPLITQTVPLDYSDHSPWLLRPFPLITQTITTWLSPLFNRDRHVETQTDLRVP